MSEDGSFVALRRTRLFWIWKQSVNKSGIRDIIRLIGCYQRLVLDLYNVVPSLIWMTHKV